MSESSIRFFAAIATLLLASSPLPALQSGLLARFEAVVEERGEDLIAVRRDLHRHPEVSGEERRTSAIVAELLRELGFAVRTGVGGYGVVASLAGGKVGPTVAFRADMDAVPSDTLDPVEFRSETPGVRHICGHDIHTTIGLALAEGFAAIRDDLAGTVVLIFQPAEERATGAKAMLTDGAIEELGLSAIYALHTAPLNVGQLATMPGVMMASRDRAVVRVSGDGELQTIAVAVRQALVDAGTVTSDQAVGPAADPEFVYPQVGAPTESEGAWSFAGSVTTASRSASARARRLLEQRASQLASERVRIDVEYDERWVAGVDNDETLTASATAAAQSVLGPDAVVSSGGVVPAFSEDFGSFQERVPGVMFFLGVSNPERGWVGMPHTPGYVADEASIGVGARAMGAVLLDALAGS